MHFNKIVWTSKETMRLEFVSSFLLRASLIIKTELMCSAQLVNLFLNKVFISFFWDFPSIKTRCVRGSVDPGVQALQWYMSPSTRDVISQQNEGQFKNVAKWHFNETIRVSFKVFNVHQLYYHYVIQTAHRKRDFYRKCTVSCRYYSTILSWRF